MDRRERAVLSGFVVLAAVLPFLLPLGAPFLSWDDHANFVENARWRGLSLEHLRWMWTTTHLGPYQPLAWMSLGLDHLLWGGAPAALRATNLALHAASALLLARLFETLAAKAGAGASARERALAGAFAAAFWAAHPLRVEAVCWITERREVLSGFFYLLSALLYARDPSRILPAWSAFLAACLAKGSALTLPLSLLLLDAWPLGTWRRDPRSCLLGKLPFLLVSLGIGLIGLAGQAMDASLHSLAARPPGERLAFAVHSGAWTLAKTLWPSGLTPLLSPPAGFGPGHPLAWGSALALAALAALAWRARRRAPALPAALAHAALALAPMSGLAAFGSHLTADRYAYLPGLALSCLAGAALLAGRARAPRPAAAAAAAVVVALGLASRAQSRAWTGDEALWARVLEIEPHSIAARVNMAGVLRRAGREEEALRHERAVTALHPRLAESLNNLGAAALKRGRYDEAESYFRRALSARPDFALARRNFAAAASDRSVAALTAGRPAEAERWARTAVARAPDWALPRHNLGNALTARGRHGEAAEAFARAVALDPSLAAAWLNGGNATARAGNLPEARRRWRRALALEPKDPRPREYLLKTGGL